MRSQPSELLARVRRAVAAVEDPAVVRELGSRPAAGLARLGLAGPPPHAVLRVPRRRTQLDLGSATLLGMPLGVGAPRPPAGGGAPELRLVGYGARPATLLHGGEAELTGYAQWARSRGFSALLSSFEFEPQAAPGRGTFADLAGAPRPARAGSGAWRALVIATTDDVAALAWLSLWMSWDHYLGQLLGYPRCCIEAFDRRWPAARDHHGGDVGAALMAETERAFAGVHPWSANVFARYVRPTLTSHFPCRLDCAATETLGERYHAVLARHEPQAAACLRDDLAHPVVVTRDEGVFLLEDAELAADGDRAVVRYDPRRMLASDSTTPAALALAAADELVAGPWREALRVGERHVTGQLVSFIAPEHGGRSHALSVRPAA